MKQASYYFIFFLIVTLVFILGVRYGQHVEKTNKTVDIMLKVTPTVISISPTPISYREYKSKKWGVTFTFPSNLEIKESASTTAILFKPK